MKDTFAFPFIHLSGDYPDSYGMTLRDYFAAKVLAGIWTNSELLKIFKRGQESEEIARAAYEQADAMLKAREQ